MPRAKGLASPARTLLSRAGTLSQRLASPARTLLSRAGTLSQRPPSAPGWALLACLCASLALSPSACRRGSSPKSLKSPDTKVERAAQGPSDLALDLPPASRSLAPTIYDLWPTIRAQAAAHQLPPDLVLAIIWVESRFDTRAKSHAGAQGLMQLMPKTARSLAQKLGLPRRSLSDPDYNVELGCSYYKRLLRRLDQRQDLALAAYNAGPSRVKRWRKGPGLPDYARRYVRSVLEARNYFQVSP